MARAVLAGYPLVLKNPPFRALFLVLILAGTAWGMGLAYVSVWANEVFDAGPQAVAGLFVVSGLAGTLANPLIGMVSDRYGWRRKLIVGQLLLTSAAFLGRTVAPDYNTALALMALSGFGITGLALAMVNDVVATMPEEERRNVSRILAVERAAWAIGIILGPAIAAAIVTAAGDTRPVFVASALTQFLAIGLVLTVPDVSAARKRAAGSSGGTESVPVQPGKAAMALLMVGIVLVALPSQSRTLYMPLFVTTVLGEPAGAVGPLFTMTAVVVVMLMPYAGVAADRFGTQRVLYLGAIVGAAYGILQAASTSYLQTAMVQLLVGVGIALWGTCTLIYLQQAMPGKAGSAGGLYASSQQVTPLLAGLLLGPIAENYGIPSAFTATAGLSTLSLVLLLAAHRVLTRRGPRRTSEPHYPA